MTAVTARPDGGAQTRLQGREQPAHAAQESVARRPRWLERVARGLGTAAVGALVGAAGMPAEIVSESDDVSIEAEAERPRRARGLARLGADQLGIDPAALTEALGTHLGDDELALLEGLAALAYPITPNSTAQGVAWLLRHIDGLDRTCVICGWALSERAELRHTLAMALAELGHDVGVAEAIEVLRQDCVPQVRIAAEEAAERHQRSQRAWAVACQLEA